MSPERDERAERVERVAEAIHSAMNMATKFNLLGPMFRAYVLGMAEAAVEAEDAYRAKAQAERPEPREWR